MYASIFGNLTVIIQRLYLKSLTQHDDLRLIRDFAFSFKIPRSLQESLENHVLHETVTMKVSAINRVSPFTVSPYLSRSVGFCHGFIKVIKNIPWLQSAAQCCKFLKLRRQVRGKSYPCCFEVYLARKKCEQFFDLGHFSLNRNKTQTAVTDICLNCISFIHLTK